MSRYNHLHFRINFSKLLSDLEIWSRSTRLERKFKVQWWLWSLKLWKISLNCLGNIHTVVNVFAETRNISIISLEFKLGFWKAFLSIYLYKERIWADTKIARKHKICIVNFLTPLHVEPPGLPNPLWQCDFCEDFLSCSRKIIIISAVKKYVADISVPCITGFWMTNFMP